MRQQVLLYLEEIGWIDLIDSRWKQQVEADIKKQFPDISKEDLDYILNLVLI